jgi:ABC-type branched-subunit amino acid transport system permease subunit
MQFLRLIIAHTGAFCYGVHMTSETDRDWADNSALVAPALVGTAAGLLLGEMMHRGARRGLAFGLLALGVAALTPYTVGEIKQRINSPGTKRGAQRRLRSIREAGAVGCDEVDQQLREQGLL